MLSIISASAALLAFAAYTSAQTCDSYGLDFQNGGSYFQNSLSSDPFTALQEFEGCQNDTANNVFVDPNGDQSQCSDSALTPDDTPRLITCADWPKNKLFNGDWSLLIISNNGNGDPIAYERDFSLSVGPQQTTTVSTTATITNQITPVVNITQTSTSIATTTVPSRTTTIQTSVQPTTITPAPSTVRVTKGLITLTQVVGSVSAATTTKTVPARGTRVQDPIAKIVPTILGQLNDVAAGIINGLTGTVEDATEGLIGLTPLSQLKTASAKYKRAIIEGRTPSAELKRAFVAERRERMGRVLRKRAPDEPTVTVTGAVATSTVGQTASTRTQTVTSVVVQTSTLTSGVATVGSGGTRSTVAALASTRTVNVNVPIAVVTSTRVKRVTTSITPSSSGSLGVDNRKKLIGICLSLASDVSIRMGEGQQSYRSGDGKTSSHNL
ncbi:hypothetical protein LTR53_002208 [Teratosphaeriaceae sp. CCFEE 6253]|nr:hypothetical protein LTR53_002208 [Teratosphaeriaceae sp. CCFEE 6253]